MGLWGDIFKSASELGDSELPNIFPLSIVDSVFIKADILSTYSKILTDVVDRTTGLAEKDEPALWDNCLQSETSKGLITLLSEAMHEQADLFLVYKTGVLRIATNEEKTKILADYKKSASSDVGIFVSFRNFKKTEMLKIYSSFEYCALSSLNKSVNIAKAVQVKISDLRKSVSMADSAVAKEQGKSIARALGNGKDVMLDKLDEITTAQIDMEPTEKAIAFLDAKRAYILGLPISYISGEQTPGIGSTGEADMRAVERGLKQYYNQIIGPVFKALFDTDTKFKSQDFRQMTSNLELLKTFELITADAGISQESKNEIVWSIFDLDAKEEKKRLDAEKAAAEKQRQQTPPPPPIGATVQPASPAASSPAA